MKKKQLIDAAIETFYSKTSEEDRLKYGLGPLEFERNKELISRFLPQAGGTILEVGGGPGIYAEWLAELGFNVHLIDPVEKHIKQAKKRAARLKNPYKSIPGEAQTLDFEDESSDLIILHGPLYHLLSKDERIRALRESKRVLKPEGVLLGFAINYTASTLVGLTQGIFIQQELNEMCLEELTTGIHKAPENMPGVLSKAYYHKPEELIEEMKEAGFCSIDIYAVEGIIWLDKNYFENRSNRGKKEKMMQLLRKTEKDRNLLALSPHMMGVGVKE